MMINTEIKRWFKTNRHERFTLIPSVPIFGVKTTIDQIKSVNGGASNESIIAGVGQRVGDAVKSNSEVSAKVETNNTSSYN